MLGLLLSVQHLLKRQHLIDEQSVCLRDLGEQFLELLHLLLCCRELFGQDTNVVACGEIFRSLSSSGCGRFPANIVEIIFAPDSEVGMLEL